MLTFVLDVVLREVDGVHGGRVARAAERVAQARRVVVAQRGGAPRQARGRRARAAQHAAHALPRLAAGAHAVAAHAAEPRVVLQRHHQRDQVPTQHAHDQPKRLVQYSFKMLKENIIRKIIQLRKRCRCKSYQKPALGLY